MWKCMECGRQFAKVAAAEKAANEGCPGCGGVDIDLADEAERAEKPKRDPRLGPPTRTEFLTEKEKRFFSCYRVWISYADDHREYGRLVDAASPEDACKLAAALAADEGDGGAIILRAEAIG